MAIGAGTLPALLSPKPGVPGQISFSLYMVHELVHTTWIWAAQQFELALTGTAGKFTVAGLIALAMLGAAVLYHVVEEPARGGCAEWSTSGKPRSNPGPIWSATMATCRRSTYRRARADWAIPEWCWAALVCGESPPLAFAFAAR